MDDFDKEEVAMTFLVFNYEEVSQGDLDRIVSIQKRRDK